MTRSKSSNTGKKLGKRGQSEASKEARFKKGYDPRRNMKGRPKAFDGFRRLAVDIGEQIATTKNGIPLLWNKQEVTWAEFILLSWLTDKKYMENFCTVAYGKVPERLDLTSEGEKINTNENEIYERIMARIQGRMESGKPNKAT